MESKEFNHSSVMKFAEKVEYSAEGIVSKRVIQKEAGNISLFAFDKDQKLSEHSAPFDALVQIVDGLGEVVIAGKKYKLKAGEAIIMPANVPHAVNAVEKFKMLLTMIKSQ